MKNLITICLLSLILFGCSQNAGDKKEFFKGVFPPSSSPDEKAGENNDPETSGEGQVIGAKTQGRPETEFIQGSGSMVRQSKITLPKVVHSADGISLNFVNTGITSIISSIMGGMLERPYKIDPDVNGTLTLQTSGPVAIDSILFILEDALRLEGVAMVEAGGFMNFVPINEAPRQIASLRVGRPGSQGLPGFGVQVVPLRYSMPSEMQKILTPFAPQGGIVRVDDARGLLILAGTSQEMALMLQTIQMFDVDFFKGKSFALYRPENVEAGVLAAELEEIFEEAFGANSDAVRIIPISRINTILGVSSDLTLLKEVDIWVKRLDVAKNAQQRSIFVYHVKNSRVEDLAYSIGAIFSNGPGSSRGASQGQSGSTGNITGAGPQVIEGEGFRLVPDAINNSILVYATPLEYRQIEDALIQLDLPPKQVLIEATLAEITLNDELRYGVQWFFDSGNHGVTFSDVASGAVATQFPGLSYIFSDKDSRRLVLDALSSITDVRVVSSPKLMVLNNQQASIQVGDQVPVATQSAVSVTNPDAPIVNSVEFRDTGVIMTVTPHINENNVVTLDITQEVSDVAQTTTSGIDSPTIQQRKITSTVILENGQTIALGGLIRQNLSMSKSGIPLLSKIPILGNLFRSNNNIDRRTELIILITVRVVSNLSESQAVLDELRAKYRYLGNSSDDQPGQ